jgi:hypothetical protein
MFLWVLNILDVEHRFRRHICLYGAAHVTGSALKDGSDRPFALGFQGSQPSFAAFSMVTS